MNEILEALAKGAILENRYRIIRLLGQDGMSQIHLSKGMRLPG